MLGMQNWIGRTASAAREMAQLEENPQLHENLLQIAQINERLVTDPPRTFREACQWMLWYQVAGKMYNMGGSLGRIDQFLYPFYQRDLDSGILDRRGGRVSSGVSLRDGHELFATGRAGCLGNGHHESALLPRSGGGPPAEDPRERGCERG